MRGPRARSVTITCVCLVLGLATTVAVAWTLAVYRSPAKLLSFSNYVAEVPRPSGAGEDRLEGYLLSFSDSSRIGDRTIFIMAIGEPQLGRQTLSPRPSLPREIDQFLNARWQAEFGEGQDLSSNMQVVRVFGFPFPCLWYGDAWNQPSPTGPGWHDDRYGCHPLSGPSVVGSRSHLKDL